MKRLLLLTFALALTALPAAAQSRDATPGDTSPGGAAAIERAAGGEHRVPSGHFAFVLQSGTGNVAAIDQAGAGHYAAIYQIGAYNVTRVTQRDANNWAFIAFDGRSNRLVLTQTGAENSYVLAFEGSGFPRSGYTHTVTQTGASKIKQVGRGLRAFDVRSRGMDVTIRHH